MTIAGGGVRIRYIAGRERERGGKREHSLLMFVDWIEFRMTGMNVLYVYPWYVTYDQFLFSPRMIIFGKWGRKRKNTKYILNERNLDDGHVIGER